MAPVCSRQSARGRAEGALNVLQMNTSSAPAALLQGREIAGGLRADQAAKAKRLAGNRDLVAGVVDDLQEETGVGSTLVQLAGRVQVARAVAVRHDEPATAAQLPDEVGDPAVVLLVRGDERL